MPSCWEILPPSSSREAGCRSSPPAGQGPGFTGHSRRRADNRLPQAQGEWRPAQGDRASGIPKAFTGTCSAVSALSPPVIQVVPPLPPVPEACRILGGPSLPPTQHAHIRAPTLPQGCVSGQRDRSWAPCPRPGERRHCPWAVASWARCVWVLEAQGFHGPATVPLPQGQAPFGNRSRGVEV